MLNVYGIILNPHHPLSLQPQASDVGSWLEMVGSHPDLGLMILSGNDLTLTGFLFSRFDLTFFLRGWQNIILGYSLDILQMLSVGHWQGDLN